MKPFVFAFVIFVVAAATGDGALAQNYPWCADYSSGGTNCGFVTFEQCLATVSGIGGFCDQNTRSWCSGRLQSVERQAQTLRLTSFAFDESDDPDRRTLPG